MKVTDSCICCGACEVNCPTGAIAMGDGQYVIDDDTCVECYACM